MPKATVPFRLQLKQAPVQITAFIQHVKKVKNENDSHLFNAQWQQ